MKAEPPEPDATVQESDDGGPSSPTVLDTREMVVDTLDGLVIERAETVERVVDTKDGPRTALDCLVSARNAT